MTRLIDCLCLRWLHQGANELADAFVIENDRDASCTDEHCDPAPHEQGIREIYLEAVPVHQGHRKWLEWSPPLECGQGVVKVVRGHCLPRSAAELRPFDHST